MTSLVVWPVCQSFVFYLSFILLLWLLCYSFLLISCRTSAFHDLTLYRPRFDLSKCRTILSDVARKILIFSKSFLSSSTSDKKVKCATRFLHCNRKRWFDSSSKTVREKSQFHYVYSLLTLSIRLAPMRYTIVFDIHLIFPALRASAIHSFVFCPVSYIFWCPLVCWDDACYDLDRRGTQLTL